MDVRIKMWILVGVLFGILYGVITGIGTYIGLGDIKSYIILAVLFMAIQYLIGPSLVAMMMRVKYVSEVEEPELHRMVAELSQRAGIPKPKVGISQIAIPNAFAFGKSQRDGRVCITQGIKKLLSKDELRAVIGHEISHLKHRDMLIITLLSVIPLILYWVAQSLLWGGIGNRKQGDGFSGLVGLGAMMVYFVSNLLVLYGSRIREYYADEESVRIGNPPHQLASALYKLVNVTAPLRTSAEGQRELRKVEGVKAFFVNDVGQAWDEIRQIRELGMNSGGSIDQNALLALRYKKVKLGGAEKMLELFTTHPNMLLRIKHLAELT